MSTKAGEVLSVLGDAIAGIAPIVGGPVGAGMAGAARIIRAASAALIRGESVDDIMLRMKTAPVVTKPWAPDPLEDTLPATPSSKGGQQ